MTDLEIALTVIVFTLLGVIGLMAWSLRNQLEKETGDCECPACNGSGMAPMSRGHAAFCPLCQGDGWL